MRGSPPSSVLKLGISSGVPSSRLAALLALHRAKEPETPVSMEEVTSSPDLIEGVKNGRYDIGLVATTTPADDAPLWREELAVAVPDRSPLLRYAAISLGALLSYPLFQYCPLACEVLFGQEWPVLYGVTSYELMTVMVSAGYGVGIAPPFTHRTVPELGCCDATVGGRLLLDRNAHVPIRAERLARHRAFRQASADDRVVPPSRRGRGPSICWMSSARRTTCTAISNVSSVTASIGDWPPNSS